MTWALLTWIAMASAFTVAISALVGLVTAEVFRVNVPAASDVLGLGAAER